MINPSAVNPLSDVNPNEIDNIPDSYKPIIYQIPEVNKKLSNIKPEFSNNIAYPLISNGFQQYLHANVLKMEIIKEFIGKKKVYSTMRLFNNKIDNYDTDIENVSREYFFFKEKDKILGNGFYKFWEIMSYFNFNTDETLNSLHLLESDLSLVQSLIQFRNMFMKNNTSDKHYVVLSNKLNTEETNFLNNKKISSIKTPDTFNICDLSNIKTIIKNVPKKIKLITAYGAPDWKYNILLEQNMINTVIGEITTALNILEDKGTFICRVYETFSLPMNKLIYMLSSCFEKIYIFKPLLSHMSSSEKFLVCLNYQSNKKILEQLDLLIKNISEKSKLNVIDIFPELEIPTNFNETIVQMNTEIANKQCLSINKIVKFIKSQNYYGEMYIEGRDQQIIASKFWINQYYPMKKDFPKMIKNLEKIMKQKINKSFD
jgi:23S rRNA U2552 (ribose-2'-O)-methylase RlmE/FtsJ